MRFCFCVPFTLIVWLELMRTTKRNGIHCFEEPVFPPAFHRSLVSVQREITLGMVPHSLMARVVSSSRGHSGSFLANLLCSEMGRKQRHGSVRCTCGRYLLSSDCGADKIALCFFFTSSTFACILSIISRISSTSLKKSSMNPSRPSTLTATSSGPTSSSSL